VTLTWNIN